MSSRRNPFEELQRMIDQMNRQLESTVGAGIESSMGGSINVDVADEGDELVVTADLPGFEREDIDVRLDGNRLWLSAERESEREEGDEDGTYVRRERSHQSVSRSVTLPEDVAESEVSARYRNGVLTVTLPKAREGGGTSIDVS